MDSKLMRMFVGQVVTARPSDGIVIRIGDPPARPFDFSADGGFVIPEPLAGRIIWKIRGRVRRASNGFRRHARRLKAVGRWPGGPVSPYNKLRSEMPN